MTRRLVAEPVVEITSALGEGPVWDANLDALVWVDILGSKVHSWRPGGALATFDAGVHVGAALPAAGGGWLLAVQHGFVTMDGGGRVRQLLAVHDRPDLRFNDAKVDPAGRAWAGTMAYDECPGSGCLYRLDPGPVATPVLAGVGISNGLGWSPDGRTFYYVDTVAGTLRAFDYEPDTGAIADERVLVQLPPDRGFLDGLCVDDDGCIWVAVWDGRRVERYTPAGLPDTVVEVPVDRPTSCCLAPGGVLYITSAGGPVFAVDVGTTAPPATLWAPLS